MKSFMLDDTHDVSITDNQIDMIADNELLAQTLQAVWSTNKKEWSLNPEEGIDIYTILTKNPDVDLIKNELQTAAEKIDSEIKIIDFSTSQDKAARTMTVNVIIQKGSETYPIPLEY